MTRHFYEESATTNFPGDGKVVIFMVAEEMVHERQKTAGKRKNVCVCVCVCVLDEERHQS